MAADSKKNQCRRALTPCGKCRECQHGDFGICTSGSPFGSPLFGCQAEYYLVPNADVCVAKVPESVSDEHALLATDIMSAGFAGIERADAGVGDSVAIFAQGPLGLCATAGARVMGCGLIIAVDSIPDRLEVAKRLGANVVINPKEKDPVAEITALTGGEGVEIAVEAVGAQATLEAASRVVRRGGTISSIGIYTQVPQVSMPTLIPSFHHRRLVTTMCPSGRDRMEHLLALLQHGDLELETLFTHRMKLPDTPEAYDLFRSKADGVLKIAITM